MESSLLVKVVPTASAGQLDLAEFVAGFAEQSLLSVCVRQVGVIRVVDEAEPVVDPCRCPCTEFRVDEYIVTWSWKALLIVAVGVTVETAKDPLERPCAGRCQPDFLRELLELSCVSQVRRKINRRRREAEVDADGSSQRRGITANEDIAVQV